MEIGDRPRFFTFHAKNVTCPLSPSTPFTFSTYPELIDKFKLLFSHYYLTKFQFSLLAMASQCVFLTTDTDEKRKIDSIWTAGEEIELDLGSFQLKKWNDSKHQQRRQENEVNETQPIEAKWHD